MENFLHFIKYYSTIEKAILSTNDFNPIQPGRGGGGAFDARANFD